MNKNYKCYVDKAKEDEDKRVKLKYDEGFVYDNPFQQLEKETNNLKKEIIKAFRELPGIQWIVKKLIGK